MDVMSVSPKMKQKTLIERRARMVDRVRMRAVLGRSMGVKGAGRVPAQRTLFWAMRAFAATGGSGGGMSPTDKSKARKAVKGLVSKEKLGGVFDDVPEQVLVADDVDFRVWAVLATDETLRRVAELHTERLVKRKRGLRMNKADRISDVGLKLVGEALGPHLLVSCAQFGTFILAFT